MQDTITQAELEKKMTTGSPDDNKGALGHFALKNAKEIQSWQDKFCEMSKVYASCLDHNGNPLSSFSGNPHEVEIIKKYVTDIRIRNIFKRVSESELEDQAVEIT